MTLVGCFSHVFYVVGLVLITCVGKEGPKPFLRDSIKVDVFCIRYEILYFGSVERNNRRLD